MPSGPPVSLGVSDAHGAQGDPDAHSLRFGRSARRNSSLVIAALVASRRCACRPGLSTQGANTWRPAHETDSNDLAYLLHIDSSEVAEDERWKLIGWSGSQAGQRPRL